MTNDFNVIGERKDDDMHLLVLGEDGQHYDYSLANEQVMPVEPDERWAIDREPPPDDDVEPAEGEGSGRSPEPGTSR